VVDEAGANLTVSHPRGDTWSIAAAGHKRLKVRYEIPIDKGAQRRGMFASDEKIVHYGGPSVYLYVVGRKQERCRLDLAVPENWQVAVSLKPAGRQAGLRRFEAKDYDVLADCPVTMGEFPEERYVEGGQEYRLAFRGPAKDQIDRQRAVRICRFITRAETDFFGGAPLDRYVWHIWANEGRDGAGGLEHATSSQIFLTTGEGPRALAGLAHEFFHLWNVKRIRSKVLGPFDYTRLPQTGALWWLEGVTDYYAQLLPYRSGAWGRDRFLADAMTQIRAVRSNPARLEVSPYDASYRIPEAVNSFSSGYRVNYYRTGWVLGIMFDIELRARSNGRRSLDDVERALWRLCKDDQPGFEEDEIRRQLIRFGGESMGNLYDQWVLKPGELPVEQQLGRVGLVIDEKENGPGGQPGVIKERSDITPAQRKLLEGWLDSRPPAHILDASPEKPQQ
jgi:predicted metalloprotease with PDZ domain